MNLNNFTVEEIKLSSEEKQQVTRKIERSGSHNTKYRLIREAVGGNCTYCYGAIPSKKVIYDVDGGKLVEWFCSPCWQRHKGQLHLRLENMNFT